MLAKRRSETGARPFALIPFSAALVLTGALFVSETAVAESTADHSRFAQLQKPFASGPEVTKACLDCHTEAGKQVMQSVHWTWAKKNPRTERVEGKLVTINSFCGSPISNEPRCTSCHVGYGWEDAGFDHTNQTNVDCLACHDTTGEYWKLFNGAGHPIYEPTVVNGELKQPPDLTKIAQNVGPSSRANCGACHFYGGGGDGVKHGDLDSSLFQPAKAVDVHMSPDGANLQCADCHTFDSHIPDGSRFDMTAKDTHGLDKPFETHEGHATCESCHSQQPHKMAKLNDHTDRVACQTCHIPEFARGGVATKTWWDWSTAGRMDENGKPLSIKDDHGHWAYLATKGDFEYAENVVPTYAWFNGVVEGTSATDTIDDSGVWPMNRIGGSPNDGESRIYPFKVMRGKQPYDPVNKRLVINHVYGDDDAAFWTNFDYDKAIAWGMREAGLEWSGQYDFIETTMHWPITHMVAPKEDALRCGECHTRDGGRLANLSGFYMPGRDTVPWVEGIGFGMLGLAGLGVFGHGLVRLLTRNRRHDGED